MKELCKKLGMFEPALRSTVEHDLRRMPGVNPRGMEMTALAGGASVRGYARIRLEPGAKKTSLVLMILADPDPARGVEEVRAGGALRELPFINVHRHLAACGVPVPEIYYYNRERGLIYIEDCGDVHLRSAAESSDLEYKRKWFEAAIRELVKIQVDGTKRKSPDFIGFQVRFDRSLLMWELNHFSEYALKKRFPGSLGRADEARIDGHFKAMTEELLAGPYALCHRDYHLDNLLIKDGRIRVIDFQDALMGPLAYDLACFLYDRDTSALLGNELIEHLVDYYADAFCERSGQPLERERYRRLFELCVIHRMLKVVGRFHFIDQVKRRPEYLRFIPFMLPVIADYLGRGPARCELREIIAGYLPELGEYVP